MGGPSLDSDRIHRERSRREQNKMARSESEIKPKLSANGDNARRSGSGWRPSFCCFRCRIADPRPAPPFVRCETGAPHRSMRPCSVSFSFLRRLQRSRVLQRTCARQLQASMLTRTDGALTGALSRVMSWRRRCGFNNAPDNDRKLT